MKTLIWGSFKFSSTNKTQFLSTLEEQLVCFWIGEHDQSQFSKGNDSSKWLGLWSDTSLRIWMQQSKSGLTVWLRNCSSSSRTRENATQNCIWTLIFRERTALWGTQGFIWNTQLHPPKRQTICSDTKVSLCILSWNRQTEPNTSACLYKLRQISQLITVTDREASTKEKPTRLY